MEDTSMTARVTDGVVLSIEDIKEQASKKLPKFASGEVPFPHHRNVIYVLGMAPI